MLDETREQLLAATIHTLEQESRPVRATALPYLIAKHTGRRAPNEQFMIGLRRELEAAQITTEYVDRTQRYNPRMVVLTGGRWIVRATMLDVVAEHATITLHGVANDELQTDIRAALARVITGHGGTVPDEIPNPDPERQQQP